MAFCRYPALPRLQKHHIKNTLKFPLLYIFYCPERFGRHVVAVCYNRWVWFPFGNINDEYEYDQDELEVDYDNITTQE